MSEKTGWIEWPMGALQEIERLEKEVIEWQDRYRALVTKHYGLGKQTLITKGIQANEKNSV